MSRIAKALVATVAAGVAVTGMAGVASADAKAGGAAVGSPGVLSGNVIQVPIHIPINLCGNTINLVGLLNPAFGNSCINADVTNHGYVHDEHRRR
ncbi:chaplin [Streptomyces sp. NRRL S-1448]|uniref:chaplin n=1 Tax=Streptomyces sp. NRRL S-1448 TaxID=1463883 RepID=UPI0004C29309|nr:chaplin [Streptomyces sp. NRRL S-1448]